MSLTQSASSNSDNATYAPFIESDAAASVETLRATMNENGYLFFRGLVPADEVLATRREVLQHCADAGWLDTAHDLMQGIAAPGHKPLTEGMPEYSAVYRKILKTPRFHDFPAHPALMSVAHKLLQSEVFVHPRRIGRVTFPQNIVATTPPHQDHYYIRGAVETYSCWIPLGECPVELGGLAVWPRSQHNGYIEHTVHSPGAVGGCGVPVDESKAVWHTCDFGLGDALFFHSYTIHKAMPNLTTDRLRVSTDNRYQRPKDEIDPGALQPHYGLN
ncbi:MAG TPA: phytanoyl-CoA dioxygenase family protein [Abditibacteriaceae bacterium]|jgi:ectoine hydroxylase-related dioxygenase (phytanoyl-CoA dioxygenase family)